MGNFDNCVDVRIVPHHGLWAVKLTGGFGNKPAKVTESLTEGRSVAAGLAIKYQVPLIEYDENGTYIKKTAWKKLGSVR